MTDKPLESAASIGGANLAATGIAAALHKDSYTGMPESSLQSKTNLSGPLPSFAEASAFRIVKDIEDIADAKSDQEAFLNFPLLASSATTALVGMIAEIPSGGVSTGLTVGGVSCFVYSLARGLKDGADWKYAADDMNSALDELLNQQRNGQMNAHDVERFATLMHVLPANQLTEIFDTEQLAKYNELIAGASIKDRASI